MTERAERLESHVRALAGEIGERNVFTPGSLEATADWIEERWAGQGYEVKRLPYESRGHEVCNLEVRVPASGWPDVDSAADSDEPGSQDYPPLMVTDTSFYRYEHYHRPTDTPEKLDYRSMARVVDGLVGMVERLVDG